MQGLGGYCPGAFKSPTCRIMSQVPYCCPGRTSTQGCISAEEWGQDSGEGCLVPKPRLGRGTGGVYTPKSNENSKVFSTILTRDQVTCQLGYADQVLLLPAPVSIPARCSCIPSLLGCGMSQEILPRNPWMDSQPHSGAAMGRMETVIPVQGWAGIHLPLPFPYLPVLCPVPSWKAQGPRVLEDSGLPQSSGRRRGCQGFALSPVMQRF